MKILIAYGTTEGQTRKIAERAAEHLRTRGADVTLWDSADERFGLNLDDFGAVILAASVHQEQHQQAVRAFATAHHGFLNGRPSALISVSLSAVLEETMPDARGYAERFTALTGWRPAMTLLLGGALRFAEYDYFQRQIVKFIVMKRGLEGDDGDDGEDGEREFTDWDALARFLDGFLTSARGSSAAT